MSGSIRLARSVFLPLFLFAIAFSPAVSRAQDVVQPEVANSRFQFAGTVNSPDVYVRSGPGEAYYTTMKIPQGAQVTVVGIKFDWLKILPPDGSFCYVSKLFIDRRGDGSVGRATRSDINVRAGSALNPAKTTVLSKLNAGDDVKILGEEDEYYKIAPPAGTYLYVSKQFVDPLHVLKADAVAPAPLEADSSVPMTDDSNAAKVPSTQPTGAVAAATTQPSVPAGPTPSELAQAAFGAIETEFNAASQKPLEEQPLADLSQRYDALSKNPALAESDRGTAAFRVAVLKVRLDAQQRLAQVHQMDAAAAAKDKVLKAEQEELQKRLDANETRLYAAVGQLQPSSLQFGPQTLYRLTDPATGRTVIYVRGDDTAAVKLMGQFVGVRGDAITDDQLNIKFIPFTVIEIVDPAQVNSKVVAGIIPPSMAGQAVQASAGNN